VEDWAEIHRLHRAEGLPIKMIARTLGNATTVPSALPPCAQPMSASVCESSSCKTGAAVAVSSAAARMSFHVRRVRETRNRSLARPPAGWLPRDHAVTIRAPVPAQPSGPPPPTPSCSSNVVRMPIERASGSITTVSSAAESDVNTRHNNPAI
jgi:hypothetical protein